MQDMRSSSLRSPSFFKPQCINDEPLEIPERVHCNPIEASAMQGRKIRQVPLETPQHKAGRQKIMNTYAAILRMPPTEKKAILKKLEKPQAQDISKIVWIFLHLFIDKEITPEEEPRNRITLSKVLVDYFNKNYCVKNNVIADVLSYAIQCYAYVAANGFYKYLGEKCQIPYCVGPYQKEADILYTSLAEGLKVDFPEHIFDKDAVESIGMNALIYVNGIRKNDHKSLKEVLFKRKVHT